MEWWVNWLLRKTAMRWDALVSRGDMIHSKIHMKYEPRTQCSLPSLGMTECSRGFHQEETQLDVCGHLFPGMHGCHSSGKEEELNVTIQNLCFLVNLLCSCVFKSKLSCGACFGTYVQYLWPSLFGPKPLLCNNDCCNTEGWIKLCLRSPVPKCRARERQKETSKK